MIAQSEGRAAPSTPSEDESELPRIYVACLASYNAGRLHGVWIEVDPDDPDALTDAVAEMLKASPAPGAEEWAIHDHEGFAGLRVSEWESWQDVHELARLVLDHDHDVLAAAARITDNVGRIAILVEEGYRGTYDSPRDWAEAHLPEVWDLPEHVWAFIDFEAYARDVEMSGDLVFARTSRGHVVVLDLNV